MKTQFAERIILIGPTGSGKSTVGAHIAMLLGWPFIDTDEWVASHAGMSVPDIFAHDGEARFRELESAALLDATTGGPCVVATGGGIGDRPANVEQMRASGWVIALRVTPDTALRRLTAEATTSGTSIATARPMLVGHDPLARIQALNTRREAWYSAADAAIDTDASPADELASRIVAELVARGLVPPGGATEHVRRVRTLTGGSYDAIVRWGGLATLGERLRERGLPPRLHVVADATVATLYAPTLFQQLMKAGFEPALYQVPPGEASKSRAQLDAIHDWLAGRRAERAEALVALGGGMIGDLAGFAAATYLRGLPLIQVPTSLLAQVDASIGGKVAINHPRGKNLIGAFYPPRLVLADPATLLTMPRRQRTEGWAEVVKHGVALDEAYLTTLEREADALVHLDPAATTRAIAGSVAIKAGVVEADEHEGEGGRRHLLNYGHTIGHAIEAVTGYGVWLHGEAVASGMVAAARLGRRYGLTPPDLVARQERLLTHFGLPTRADGLSARALLQAALWDKKARGGRVRWVLPTNAGVTALVGDISDDDVRAALLEIGAVDGEPPPIPD